ncbi:MAG: Chemotaxis protein MotB [Alphaproteobacteria bacterium]|nr:Chemotaxis protein MotB [Alphaproteobacteria bacterium]MDB5722598.1 Chemotaxis protein MotB [Alphaproteobacteria bacterium]
MATKPGSNQRPIIIVRKRRKSAHPHHGGAWKVAYADFVTAMMAFFMLLWLISNPDKQRLKGLAEYFSPAEPAASQTTTASPGQTPGLGSRSRRSQVDTLKAAGQPSFESATNGSSRGGTAQIPDAAMRVLAQEMQIAIDSMPETRQAKDGIRVDPTPQGVRISLMDTAKRTMFKGPTAQLNDYASQLLAAISRKIAKSGNQIAIEGHTDGVGGANEGNWRLSGARAETARVTMAAAGLSSDRFSQVVAMAGTQPVYPDQPDRPENRRITVVLLPEAPPTPRDASFKF